MYICIENFNLFILQYQIIAFSLYILVDTKWQQVVVCFSVVVRVHIYFIIVGYLFNLTQSHYFFSKLLKQVEITIIIIIIFTD